ncbi:cation diffusion facilitator family transporter [Phenylobacterium sp.]|jgi:cation diffusion facilitator family transporter|uniref:cation diffusion facilitator family transporter n=1 Tax=Phenylobacterium sp. TaxID=1871053 RepID=UPI002F419951
MAADSTRVVLTALAGNLAIAAAKFTAFAFTRSTAMLTEAIHSLVDSGNQALLLVGQKRASRPSDESHPFGYGMEVYFWAFVVALMIFLVGGALSIWQGVERLRAPAPIERPWLSLGVIAVSAVFEASSFAVAYRAFRKVVRGRDVRLWRFLKISKDPSLFATLMEDGAAVTGLAIAGVGVMAASWGRMAWADGAASILIGLLLTAIAIFLANETRSLIAGEAAAPDVVARAKAAAAEDPRVEAVVEVASLHLGPQAILVAVTVDFRDGLSGDELHDAAEALTERLLKIDPRVCRVFLRPGRARRIQRRNVTAA